jgi:hypothetical protein
MSLFIASLASYNTKKAFAIFLAIVISVIILFAVLFPGFFLFVTGYYIFLSYITLIRVI